MKTFNIKLKSLMIILLIIASTACNKGFLDQVPNDRINIDDVFKKKTQTLRYLANVYAYIRSDSEWNVSSSPWEGLSDEIDITYDNYATYAMNVGNWDINRGDYNYWTQYYRGIRSASYFIQRLPENQELTTEEKVQYTAEARVLRAWFYFNLMRQYGPVIIIPNIPLEPDADLADLALPRSSYDECVAYVESEIDKALVDLKPVPVDAGENNEWARINKGMALGLKSRLLLQAASPLFNGNTAYASFKNKDGKQLISQQVSVEKWAKAAAAAKAVIDMPNYSLYKELDASGNIKPYESLKNVFLNDWNSEIIMARVSNMRPLDENGSPRKVNGWSSWNPTQQAVDAYFTANGKTITDPTSGYSETGFSTAGNNYYDVGTYNMYVNREPRFYVAVSFNGSKWISTEGGTGNVPFTLQMYNGGNSGKYNGRNYSRTGYALRKFVHPSTRLSTNTIAGRTEVLMRLAEFYLNYAEALNEANPGNPDILKYLNLIRERAGIPQYGAGTNPVPVPVGQDAMREAIRRERRVELAFEQHRFFDARRWKIAEQTDGGPFYGMDVDATTTAAFSKRVVFETRVWNNRNYLWNIVQSELNRDVNLVGNPGW